MNDAIRVLLADDHPIFRSGLHTVLSGTPGILVVAEAGDGEAALAAVRRLRPDVAVLDLDMPKLDGLAVAAAIAAEGLAVHVALLTAHKSEAHLDKALAAGIRGYVVKDAAAVDIVDCIRAVHGGREYVSPQLTTLLLNRSRRAANLAGTKPGLAALTATERRVLQLIADQHSSKAIADQLSISVRTVENHRASICAKLDLHGVNALTKFAVAHRSDLASR
jgi:DNA-binding NarL/FixJ family response regulator